MEQRALRWGEKNVNATMAEETLFVDQIYREYRRLVDACHYLIVVEHISAEAPTQADYESNPVTWRVRAVVSRCIAEADRVIYHDKEDVSYKDRRFVEQTANVMITLGPS